MKNNKLSSLSFFMPCFNEEENIEIAVKEAFEILPKIAYISELIVIDDGSKDLSLEVLNRLTSKYNNLIIVNHKKNLGYGAALKSGFMKAKFDWIFFTDSDLQFDLSQLELFLKFTNTFDAVIGYRKKRAEGFKRALNMFLYKLVVDLLFSLNIRDVDCAFKLFKSNLLNNLNLQSNGAFLSTEFLCKIKEQGAKIKQIPVKHQLRKYGKPTGANLKVIFKALADLLNYYIGQKYHREN